MSDAVFMYGLRAKGSEKVLGYKVHGRDHELDASSLGFWLVPTRKLAKAAMPPNREWQLTSYNMPRHKFPLGSLVIVRVKMEFTEIV